MSETAVVTGATGGIGQAVVTTLAANGYDVYAVGRAPDKLAAVRAENVFACTADLSRLESLPDALADLERVHALVHCAGVSEVATVEDTPRAVWMRPSR
jgi:short-subunit dehydrogenase